MDLIGRRRIWFALSLLILVPGIFSLVVWRLKPGIDFVGGSVMEVSGGSQAALIQGAAAQGFRDITVTTTGSGDLLLHYRDPAAGNVQEANHQKLKAALAVQGASEVSYQVVGPSVSRDITRNAIISVALASLAIVLYIAFAFRNTPPPVSSWSFGATAVVALLHDTLVLLGIFSLLGHFAGVEIDSLFVTAALTVIGFSVHDTIVVYDRIRENLRRSRGSFEEIVNRSILETLARSINTSLTVLLTLLALLLFGGASIHYFVLALLIGILSGTYSSIFNAAPLLVVWHNYKLKRARVKK